MGDETIILSDDSSTELEDNDFLPDVCVIGKSVETVVIETNKQEKQILSNHDKRNNEKKKETKTNQNQSKHVLQNKMYKPGECVKYMCLEAETELLKKWYLLDVNTEMTKLEARVIPTKQQFESIITFSRRPKENTLTVNNCFVNVGEVIEPVDYAILLLEMYEVAELIKQNTLMTRIKHVVKETNKDVTLIIFGKEKYFSKKKRKNSFADQVSRIDLQCVVADLLISESMMVHCAETSSELALFITGMIKAIAEQPCKKEKRKIDEQVNFYAQGDNKKTIRVTKEGDGLKQCWQQILAIMPLSSLETSRAICSKYKNLKMFYQNCQTSDHVNELANVGIMRSNVPNSRARKLGPEFARKLHTLFNSEDGNIVLD